MAACEKSLRHYAAALVLIERYLKEGEGQLTAQDRRDADSVVSAIRPLVSVVTVRARTMDAVVYLDGERVGTTPLAAPLRVDIGRRTLRVEKPGFRTDERTFEPSGNADMTIDVELEQSVHSGTLVVHARSQDLISLDGKPLGTGSAQASIETGVHVLRVSADGREPREVSVTIEENKTKTMDLESEGRKSNTWLWVAGGAVLAVGAGVGGYFLLRPSTPERGSPTPGSMNPGSVQLP
jgi:hypothetical protein